MSKWCKIQVLIIDTNPDGTLKQFAYQGFDEIITDENLHVKRITKDSLGRLVKVQEATGGITQYQYDLFGNLTLTVDPLVSQTHITYDNLGRKVAMDDPYMGHWEYRYDAAGNLIRQQDGEGRIVNMDYDPLNRIETKTFTDSGRMVEYIYGQERGNYYNIGALTTMVTTQITTDPPSSFYHRVEHDYDNMGRRAHDKRSIDGVDYDTYQSYDPAGRLKQVVYPNNSAVFEYGYHPMGYLQTVEKIATDATRSEMVRYSDFNAAGQARLVAYGNGVKTDYTYYDDGSRRLQNLRTNAKTDSQTWSDIQNLDYTFYDNGNVETITDHVNQVDYAFVYDELDRLQSATALSADPDRAYNQAYSYDLAGNMTRKLGKGAFQVMAWQDQATHIRPARVMYRHGTSGLGERHIDYNQENKPSAITYNGATTRLYYDGGGNRIKKQAGGGAATIYVGGLYEMRGSDILINVYAGAARIATFKNGAAFYTHADHLGSTTLVTNADGLRVEEIGYLPFGAALFRKAYQGGFWDSVYRFTGQEYDAEYALYNYNARLYDPIACRFITADTVVPDWTNPQSLNRYAYVMNNPLKYVDPSGNNPFAVAVIVGLITGMIVGGVMAAMNGGNVIQGMVLGGITGAISGAFFYGAHVLCFEAWSIAQHAANIAIHSIAGAMSGAVNAAITGGDIKQGAKSQNK